MSKQKIRTLSSESHNKQFIINVSFLVLPEKGGP